MHYILYIRTVGMFAKAAQARRSIRDRACVVYQGDRICDLDPLARARQVQFGISLQEAKTILRSDATYIEYQPEEFAEIRDQFVQPILNYVDALEIGSWGGEAFVDLAHHPDPIEMAGHLLKDILLGKDWDLVAGLSSAKWIARLTAQPVESRVARLGLLPITAILDPAEWLRKQDVRVLLPISQPDRIRLAQLGFDRVALIQDSPLERLERQFPKRGAFILKTAQGKLSDPVRSNFPAGTLSCRRVLERVESTIELENVLGVMARELAAKLSRTDQQSSGMSLTLRFEDDSYQSVSRQFPKPILSASQLLVAILHGLKQIELKQAVCEVRVLLTGVSASARKQGQLTATLVRDTTLLPSTIQRLSASIGTGAVKKASEVRTGYQQRVLKEWKNATGWK